MTKTRKRRRSLLLLAGVLLAFGVYMVVHRLSQPFYRNRSLSTWVERYGFGNPEEVRAEAAEAIRHLGTNAVPYLVRWIEADTGPSRLRVAAQRAMERVNSSWYLGEDPRAEKAWRASYAFGTLGPDAVRIALPELKRIAGQTNNYDAARGAMWALAEIKGEGFPVIFGFVTNQDSILRHFAAGYIHEQGTNALSAIPFFLQRLKYQDLWTAADAADALGGLGLEPASVVPALTEALQDPRPLVRQYAAGGLRNFGPEAKPAVPALRQALNDPDGQVRRFAQEALARIAPESLTNTLPR